MIDIRKFIGQFLRKSLKQYPLKLAIDETIKNISNAAEIPKRAKKEGVQFGFNDLDMKFNALGAGDLIVVAGRPAMGKSVFVHNMAANIALRQNSPVGIISSDESMNSVAHRILCTEARVDRHLALTGHIAASDWPRLTAAAGMISHAPIYIDDMSFTSDDVSASARHMRGEYGIGCLIIDSLPNLVYSRIVNIFDRSDHGVTLCAQLKQLARNLKIPIIVTCGISRAVERREKHFPSLSDVKDYGEDIEHSADAIILLYRHEYYEPNPENHGMTDVIVAKNRNGPVGVVRMHFAASCLRFEDIPLTNR